jgi:outer membrane lipoprotein-sorting protein
MNFRPSEALLTTVLLVLLMQPGVSPAETTPPSSPPALTADVIVQKLMAANARRAAALRSYRGTRHYRVDYHGIFGSHTAEMQVDATYTAPDKKDFQVVSQTGSKILYNRVLLTLLRSEQEAQEEKIRKELEISPQNYKFTLEGIEHASDGDFYVLRLTPRSSSKYIYDGKIWVDARDFAVARMQGNPAKNPSLWVSHTELQYQWQKFGAFWLPIHTESVTQVRLGGKATLTIDYANYQLSATNLAPNTAGSPSDPLPDPATVTADPH